MFWRPKASKLDLAEELYARIVPVIQSWDTSSGIYAISLFVCDKQDNPCEPTVTLGYNTEADYNTALSDASGELEARWNYAFWQQNEAYVFGENGESADLVHKWLKQEGLVSFSYEEMFNSNIVENIPESEFLRITAQFVDVLVKLVQRLHTTGQTVCH